MEFTAAASSSSKVFNRTHHLSLLSTPPQSQKSSILFNPSSNAVPRFSTMSFSPRDLSCKSTIKDTNASIATRQMAGDGLLDFELSNSTALSPLDGRYWNKSSICLLVSEYGLIYYSVPVEIKWLLKLSQIPEVIEVPNFSEEVKAYVEGLIDGYHG